jgi:hypothetical protein
MANSTGKIIGLIALVALIMLIGIRITPFILVAPFRVVTNLVHHTTPLGVFEIGFILLLVLWIWAIIWVYRDAEKRGMNGTLWALLVLVGSIIGLIIYLIIRNEEGILSSGKKDEPKKPCPGCQEPISPGYIFCPHCGKRLQAICPGCEKPVDEKWKVCPHCGKKLTGSKK